MQGIINDIVYCMFLSIVILNFLFLTFGVNMNTKLLLLNKKICDLKAEISILQKTKKSSLEISYLKLLIAKNQDRILTLLER